jgi:glycosidase
MDPTATGPAARYRDAAPAHHPGPPRFVAVGDHVDLAPRDPDPDAAYRWSLESAPAASSVAVGDAPVLAFTPDAPGRYRLTCAGPDSVHAVTVRAFPACRTEVELSAPTSALRAAVGDDDRLDTTTAYSVCGPFNEWRVGELPATRERGRVGRTVSLPPGEHRYVVVPDGDLGAGVSGTVDVSGPGRPRLELAATVEAGVVRVAATTHAAGRREAAAGASGSERGERHASRAVDDDATPEVRFELDDRDGLDRTEVRVDGDTLAVPLAALDGPARVHAVAVGTRASLPATVQVDPDGTVSQPDRAPAWVRDATVYEIFVRAFAGETVDTTFAELERRLPYIESLGVDCLWLTPVVASPTTHGYHVTDYFDTAADLGTPAEYERFVAACHERGIRVLFDLVANHTSRDHPAFQFRAAGVEPYVDYYADRRGADPSDIEWAGDPPDYYFNWTRIPNLSYDSLGVRRWLLDVVDRWAPVVDGFRCDVAWGVPSGFWREVRDRVRAEDAEFLMLDETVPRAAGDTAGFGCHHDTDLYDRLCDVGAGSEPADAVLETFDEAAFAGFDPHATFLRYVENHDEDRYRPAYGEAAFRAAVAATFTLPGAPMIYAGGERNVRSTRGPMRWHDGDAAMTEYHRRLVACRDAHPVLRHGDVEPVAREVHAGDPDRVTAYARDDGDDRLVVLLNFGEGTATVAPAEPVDGRDRVREASVASERGVEVADVVVCRSDA